MVKKTVKKTVKKKAPIVESVQPKGILLMVGGAEDRGGPEKKGSYQERLDDKEPLAILQKFLELMNGKKSRFEVVTTASSVPESVFKEYTTAFHSLGAKNFDQIHHFTRKALLKNEVEMCDRLEKADGIWFSGGNQLKLTSIYGGTTFLKRMKEKYLNTPFVVGGTSAGAMALTTPMIYFTPGDGDILKGDVRTTTGLEFMKDIIVDTHFIHRGRMIRMAQIVATNPTCIGIGIEEDTAAILRAGDTLEIFGNGSVVILDGHDCEHTNVAEASANSPVTIDSLKIRLLAKYDRVLLPKENPPHT